jgi:hypothetical protein
MDGSPAKIAAMKLKEEFTYPAGAAKVFDLIEDPAFRKKSAEATGGRDVDVDVKPSGKGVTITIVRSQPATSDKVPGFIKSFIGETVRVKQVETWSAPDADGNRTADISLHVQGQPAGMEGQAKLTNKAAGKAAFTVQGDVKVNVPFVGKKIEPFVAKVIQKSLQYDVDAGIKVLT